MPAGGGIKIVSEANLSSLTGTGDQLISEPLHFLEDKLNYTMAKRTYVNLDTSGWAGGVATVMGQPSVPHYTQLTETKPHDSGGRRIKIEEGLLDADEEEKRRIRRERNKLAAARCRKRRVDQIESLQKDVDDWEERKRQLQAEIASLQQQRDEFKLILDAHKSVCKQINGQNSQSSASVGATPHFTGPKVVVKSEPELDSFSCGHTDGTAESLENYTMSSSISFNTSVSNVSFKPQRPVSLSLKTIPLKSIEGVSIETPTACLNFDSLIDGRTGLTPTNILAPININVSGSGVLSTPGATGATLTPSCGTQQRHQSISLTASITEMTSPSSNTPNLVSL